MSAGSLLGIEEFCERYWGWAKEKIEKVPGSWRSRLKVGALVVAVFWSGYLAWSDEHSALVAAKADADRLQGQLQNIPTTQQKTIDDLKAELDKTNRELQHFREASRLPNHVYDGDQDVAIVADLSYDKATGTLVFGLLTSQTPVDFSKELRFQWARIFCDNKKPYGGAAMGAAMNLEYKQVTCHVLGSVTPQADR